jgi:CDP-glucose 4,6-dehydratase
MEKKFWRDKSVFVTGATGILGSWLVKELVEGGANVVCLIRDWVPRSNLISTDLINNVSVVRGCIEDYMVILRALNEYEIETVFNLGAQPIVGTANRSPISTFEANIEGTWNVLEACRHIPTVKQIVVASSDKAYGDQKILPYTEETPLTGRHPYDVSKSCADLIAQSYYHTYGLPVGITRCGNFFGGGDLNWNRIVPGTMRAVIKNENPIIRSDGSPVRDYIYIEDVVDAYITVAENLTRSEIRGQAFNFGMNNPMSVIEITDKILDITGTAHLKPQILSRDKIKGEIDRQYLSSEKASRMLNWKPKFTIEEGLRKTFEWYMKFTAKDKTIEGYERV